ncbi:hypothetical protein QFZ82_004981 [Streptomyces sp. V4I23]|uniref:hypothetical protein n=1 Tax=Streptomyces sp. V4I23 TaxID=3042282 RepID=UPI0027837106|nr:hypothetical protein [Streptomyces sp. V4I23]MDQ1010496.1 hypothetical protein [Streptomyces sp. V4I23]
MLVTSGDTLFGQEGAGEDRDGVPLCRLSSVDDGRWAFSIYVRKALAIPSDRDDLGGGVTYYSTGALASSTDARAALYFKCHGPSQAEAAVIAAELELPDDAPAEKSGIRENQITVLNAAARAVAKKLKCGTTGLVEDKPRPLQ